MRTKVLLLLIADLIFVSHLSYYFIFQFDRRQSIIKTQREYESRFSSLDSNQYRTLMNSFNNLNEVIEESGKLKKRLHYSFAFKKTMMLASNTYILEITRS